MSKKNKIILIIGACAVVVVAAIRILSGNGASDPRRQLLPLVKIQKPTRESVLYKLQFTGDMVAVRQANIYAKVGGSLERVYVDIGSAVTAGQMLALIDTTELYQQYQQTYATFENARVNYQRSKELAEQNLVARQDADNAEATLKVAKANYDLAATRLGYAAITAPFTGYITKRLLDPGALVNANTTSLFWLMDLDMMKVIVNVLEKDIPLMKEGKEAQVTVDAYPGKEFVGVVKRYAQAVDVSTRTMAVEVDVQNGGHLLKPGMFARVTLVVSEHPNALTVPTQAVLSDSKGNYLFVAVKDTARRLNITTGTEQDSRIEVAKGLSGNEDIITTGQQFVRDGGAISIQAN